ncbi:MAG: hypothetical protein ACYC11_05510, partial [Bellilinea sp.]
MPSRRPRQGSFCLSACNKLRLKKRFQACCTLARGRIKLKLSGVAGGLMEQETGSFTIKKGLAQ